MFKQHEKSRLSFSNPYNAFSIEDLHRNKSKHVSSYILLLTKEMEQELVLFLLLSYHLQ